MVTNMVPLVRPCLPYQWPRSQATSLFQIRFLCPTMHIDKGFFLYICMHLVIPGNYKSSFSMVFIIFSRCVNKKGSYLQEEVTLVVTSHPHENTEVFHTSQEYCSGVVFLLYDAHRGVYNVSLPLQ